MILSLKLQKDIITRTLEKYRSGVLPTIHLGHKSFFNVVTSILTIRVIANLGILFSGENEYFSTILREGMNVIVKSLTKKKAASSQKRKIFHKFKIHQSDQRFGDEK